MSQKNDSTPGHNGRVVGRVELVKGMTRDDLISSITSRSNEGRVVDPRPTANKYPSGESIAAGVKALQKLFNLVTGTTKKTQIPGDNVDWLRDVDTVTGILNAHYTTINSRTSIKIKITALLSWLSGHEQLLSAYSRQMSESAASRDEVTSNNEMTPKQRERYVPWPEIVATFKRDVHDLDDRFLLGINILWAPRRLDLRFLRLKTLPPWVTGSVLSHDREVLPVAKNTNYVVDTGARMFLVFDVFKTSATFGRQVFELEGELVAIIREYVTGHTLKDGDLFVTQLTDDHRVRSSSSMSTLMSDILDLYFPKRGMTQVNLRQSYSTYNHEQNLSEAALKTLTARLAHSVGTSRMYYRKIK
jgi:hypothetical protein